MTPPTMIGVSAAMRSVEDEIEHAAGSDAKVLITGESGVGKEIVAHLIHDRSRRRDRRMVTINCAGVPDSLLESEMFGHIKGSFTDAHYNRGGWLEAANGGTIFMDEVGEMSLRMQAALLRFLETGEIQRVGSDRPLPRLDVRVIAATHQRLTEHVANRTFREDLYYRLNVININVPPLRERREDVFVLLSHFLAGAAHANRVTAPTVSPEAMECLTEYHWPGNVRELRNVAERLVLRARGGHINVDTLPREVLGTVKVVEPHTEWPKARAERLFRNVVTLRHSFWTEVYAPFMARDLNREELRALIRLGLQYTHGSYKMLVTAFNLPTNDYNRFLTFLRKHQCHVPYQEFRVVSTRHTPDDGGMDAPLRQLDDVADS